jgi:Threonine synthase
LEKKLGLNNLYIKNDSVNPTFSFKDRPAGVAISKAKEFGLTAVGCASTGNLASATAAHAQKLDYHVMYLHQVILKWQKLPGIIVRCKLYRS